jgi:hypothetical protein
MTIRHVARTVALSAAVVACAGGAAVIGSTGVAGAGTGVGASGNTVLNSVSAQNPDPTSGTAITPGTPFSSGQIINVSIPANSILTPGASIKIVECAAPGGTPPSTPTNNCDGNTLNSGNATVSSDGSLNFSYNASDASDFPGFQVFSLPNSAFFESNTLPVCDLSHECDLYVGQNQGDFSAPHFFTEGFYVNPGDGQNDGANPGDGLPEAPLAVGLPAAALAVFGGVLVIRRRKARKVAA